MPPLETLRKLYQVFSDFLNDANCLRFTYLCDYSRQNICGMFLASLQMLSKNVATDLDSQSASTEPCRHESHCSLSSKDNHRNSKFIGEFIVPIYTPRIRHCIQSSIPRGVVMFQRLVLMIHFYVNTQREQKLYTFWNI